MSEAPIKVAAEAVSSAVATELAAGAVGASLTGVTVTATTCSAVPPLPSSMRMVKLSEPLKSASGV
jgi:hypothetical protein